MRLPLAVCVALLSALAIALTAVSATGQGSDTRLPKGSSVGDGRGGPPPISAGVKSAARAAGCKVRAFRSEGVSHATTGFRFAQTPPVSGTHATRWADWGVYSETVPPQYQLHNLEHGGVVVHYDTGLSAAGIDGVADLYAAEPGYLVVTPRASTSLRPGEPSLKLKAFPRRGLVVTSWQRRLVCKTASAKALKAVRTYVRTYRGRGWEQVPASNSSAPRPGDLPAPAEATPEP